MYFFDIIPDLLLSLITARDTASRQVIFPFLYDISHSIVPFYLLIYMLCYLLNIMWLKIQFTNSKLSISSVVDQGKSQNA